MSDPISTETRPGGQLAGDGGDWLAAMDVIAEEDGYIDPLGPKHFAFFAETGPKLLVSFERAEQIRARPDRLPESYALARKNGWSFLCLIAEGETFWRAPEVWGYFDRLVDDAFFDDFDQVLFYGAGPAGYAAATYVVTAPGASALLLAPRATLAPDLAGWDRRHLAQRHLDFSSRYGYAPDMTEGAGRVWLIHDPLVAADNAHAALFRRPWVTGLTARFASEFPEQAFQASAILDEVIGTAMAGSLTPASFAKLWRARRQSLPYLRHLMNIAAARQGSRFEEIVCTAGAVRLKAPRFIRRLERIGNARNGIAPDSGSDADSDEPGAEG